MKLHSERILIQISAVGRQIYEEDCIENCVQRALEPTTARHTLYYKK